MKEVAELIINNGASVNLADEDGDTPLHVATLRGDFQNDCEKSLCSLFQMNETK